MEIRKVMRKQDEKVAKKWPAIKSTWHPLAARAVKQYPEIGNIWPRSDVRVDRHVEKVTESNVDSVGQHA
jgi:hypothetical protein